MLATCILNSLTETKLLTMEAKHFHIKRQLFTLLQTNNLYETRMPLQMDVLAVHFWKNKISSVSSCYCFFSFFPICFVVPKYP